MFDRGFHSVSSVPVKGRIASLSGYTGLLALAVLLFALCGTAAQAQTAYFSGVVKTLGGGFNQPDGMAVDSSGNIYVANSAGGSVQEMPPGCASASCVTTLGGGFYFPGGLALDNSGNLYIADYGNNAVKKMPTSCTSSSCVTTLGGGFSAPYGVAVDGSGNVYVADANNNRVTKMAASCTSSSCVSTLGGGFSFPSDVVVDNSGNVYVSDHYNGEVKKIPAGCLSAGCVTVLGGNGFFFPVGLALDSSGNLYLADAGSTAISKIPAGCTSSSCVTILGGGFYSPERVALDSSGNLYVADTLNYAVKEIVTQGVNFGTEAIGTATPLTQTMTFAFTTTTTLANTPYSALTLGAANLDFTAAASQPSSVCTTGTVYYAGFTCTVDVTFAPKYVGQRNGAVDIYGNSGAVIATAYVQGAGTGPQAIFTSNNYESTPGNSFSEPTGVTTDGSGNIYVADLGNGLVEDIPAGCSSSSCVIALGGSFSEPFGVAVDGGGNIYLTDQGNNEVKMMPAGCTSSSCVTVLGGGFSFPTGIAVDGSGNVYAADNGNNAVKKMPAGCTSSSCVTTIGGGFNAPEGLAVDGSGNVYVADYGSSSIKEIPPGCTSSSCVTVLGGGFSFTSGVAVDGIGNVYVADTYNGVLKEMPAGCTSSSCVSTLIGGFTLPQGVAVDGGGNIYIADLDGTIRKLDRADVPSLNFASALVSQTSADSPQTVTVANIGNTSLALSGLTEVNASFSLAGSTCTAATTLVTDASCNLSVSFTPQSLGVLSGNASLTDNTLNVSGTVQQIGLSGAGLAAALVVTADAHAIFAGTASSVLTASAAYVGLTVPTGAFTFQVDSGATVTAACTGFSSPLRCTASYNTSSLAVGNHIITGAMAADSNFNATSNTGMLTVGASADTATTTNVGTASATQTATLVFLSAATLNATQATAIQVLTQGALNLDFKYVSGGTCAAGASYNAGDSCTVEYSFTPAHPGLRYGAVELYDNEATPAVAAMVYLQGTGTGPQIIYSSNNALSVLGSGFNTPMGVAVDGSGDVFVADSSNNSVREIVAVNGVIPASPTINTLGGDFNTLTGVAVDGAGNVFVGDTNNHKVKEIPAGCVSAVCVKVLGSGFSQPAGVAVDGNGNVFVADWGLGYVREILAAGGYTTTNKLASAYVAAGNFDTPWGVAVDGSGNVFVADSGANAVDEILAAGGYVTVNTLGGGFSFNQPNDVAVDSEGNVFVADSGNNAIEEMLAANSYATVTLLQTGFSLPQGIAADGAGNVYIGDTDHGAVKELNYAIPPSLSFAATAVGSTSTPQTVTLINNGNATLTLSGLASANANFSLTGSVCTPTTSLTAGSACSLSLSFTPQDGGALAGAANITDNNLNVANAIQSIILNGTGSGFGTAAQLIFTAVPPSTLVAGGNAGMVQVSVEDANGSVVTNSAASVMLTVAGPAGYSQIYSVASSGGVAGFNVSTAPLTTPGLYTFTATSAGLTQAVAVTTVSAGAATQYTVSTVSAVLTGTTISVTVTARDAFGNVATSYTGIVQLSSTDGIAGLSANATLTNGTGSFDALLQTAGVQTITATDTVTPGITGTSNTITVVPTDIWVMNSDGSVSALYDSGVPENKYAGISVYGVAASSGTVAFDSLGQLFTADTAINEVFIVNRGLTSNNIYNSNSLDAPVALAIDGNGTAWTANSNGSVSAFANDGTSLDPASGFTGGGLNAPTGISIDISGNVWISNGGNNSVTEILGGAAPVAPLAIATQNVTLGARP